MPGRTTGQAGQGGNGFDGVCSDSDDAVEIPAHNLDKVEDAWGFCLIGYFPARIPGMAAAVQQLCDSWNVSCSAELHSSGWLVFRFNNEKDRKGVMIKGPYFMFRRPLLLKNMPEFFKFDGRELLHVPAWIKLPGLPLECWNETCLNMIVSKVGKPLYIDKKTQTRKRISHPRLLVEVDASMKLVRNVTIRLPDREFNQRIVFEWEPKYCDYCTMFGHDTNRCSSRLHCFTGWNTGGEEYRPKENNTIPADHTAGERKPMGRRTEACRLRMLKVASIQVRIRNSSNQKESCMMQLS